MAETIKSNLSVQPKKANTGTGYTNIQNILSANEGNKLGSAVEQGVQKQAIGVRQAVGNATNQFNTGVAQNRLDTPEARAAREDAISRIKSGSGINDTDVNNFTKYRAGQYTGPTTLNNEENLMNKAADVSSTARNLGTSEGRQGVLQQYVGGASPNYTSGKSALDQLFLGQSGNNLSNIRSTSSSLGRDVYKNIANARQEGQAATQSAESFGQETGKLLDKEQGSLDSEIQGKLDAAKTAETNRQNLYNQITGLLNPATGEPGEGTPGVTGDRQQQIVDLLKNAGYTNQADIDTISGLVGSMQGIAPAKQSMEKTEMQRLIDSKVASGADRINIVTGKPVNPTAYRQLQDMRSLLSSGDQTGLEDYLNTNSGNYRSVASNYLGDQEQANVLKNILASVDATNLNGKQNFVDQSAADKFAALAKLAGKDSLYNPTVDPNSLYQAGSVGTNAGNLDRINPALTNYINSLQGYNTAGYNRDAISNQISPLLQLLRGYQ